MKKNKAVALLYPPQTEAPFIAAKGKGELAEKIIRIAQEKGIPIKKNNMLTDILNVYEVGACVPPETYEVIAKIFACIRVGSKN